MAKRSSKGPRRPRVRVTAITPVRAVVRRIGPPPVPQENRHVVHHIHHMGPSMRRPAVPLGAPLARPVVGGPAPVIPRPLVPPVRPGVPPVGAPIGGMRPPGPFTVPGPAGPAPGAPIATP